GLGVLLVLDFVLGRTYFGVNAYALAAGVLVGLTIPLARRRLLLASALAVAVSLGSSYLLSRSDGVTFEAGRFDVPLRPPRADAWPGMTEAAGLLLLLCWSLRSLGIRAAVAVAAGVGACFVAMVDRNEIGYDRLVMVAYGVGLSVAAGVGLYLRWV